MSDKDRVQPADVLAQHLNPEFRGGVNDQFCVFGGYVNRRARAVVFRVGQERGWVFFANKWDSLRRAGTKNGESERHGCCVSVSTTPCRKAGLHSNENQ